MYITCQKYRSDRKQTGKKNIDNQYVYLIPPRLKERKCHYDLLQGSHLYLLSRNCIYGFSPLS